MIYDMAIIEAHAERPAPDWHTCECSSCEKRRELRLLADYLTERFEEESDFDTEGDE